MVPIRTCIFAVLIVVIPIHPVYYTSTGMRQPAVQAQYRGNTGTKYLLRTLRHLAIPQALYHWHYY